MNFYTLLLTCIKLNPQCAALQHTKGPSSDTHFAAAVWTDWREEDDGISERHREVNVRLPRLRLLDNQRDSEEARHLPRTTLLCLTKWDVVRLADLALRSLHDTVTMPHGICTVLLQIFEVLFAHRADYRCLQCNLHGVTEEYVDDGS